MHKYIMLISCTIWASFCFAQQEITIHALDSLSATIDQDITLLNEMVFSDSVKVSEDSMIVCSRYKIKRKAGKISKIEVDRYAKCTLHEEYYYIDKAVFKIILKMDCAGRMEWDSIFYFNHGIQVGWLEKATKLNWYLFKDQAETLLKKFGK